MRSNLLLCFMLLNQAVHSLNVVSHRSARLKVSNSTYLPPRQPLSKHLRLDRSPYLTYYSERPAINLFLKVKSVTSGFDSDLAICKNNGALFKSVSKLQLIQDPRICGRLRLVSSVGSFHRFKPRAKDFFWHLASPASSTYNWASLFRRNVSESKSSIFQRSYAFSVLPSTAASLSAHNFVCAQPIDFMVKFFDSVCDHHYWASCITLLRAAPLVSCTGIQRNAKAFPPSFTNPARPHIQQLNIQYMRLSSSLSTTNFGVSDANVKLHFVFYQRTTFGNTLGVKSLDAFTAFTIAQVTTPTQSIRRSVNGVILHLYLLCNRIYFFTA